jgi:beta-galactosidase
MKQSMRSLILAFGCIAVLANVVSAGRHTFVLGKTEFLLDGKPFQMISGELHPSRIPREYWRHRIRMAKAMGCNTIAAYFFWNYHESVPHRFDFTTENRNLAEFMQIVQEEEMWLLVRPGPYVCAEWDFGGLPPYLLASPDIKIRCLDPQYMSAVERYVREISNIIRPFLVTNDGPVLMVQIENEYGSYGNDKSYLEALRSLWLENNIDVPFFTADGPTPYMLEAGTVRGTAIGLDSGSDSADFATAHRFDPTVPAFSSETYPGWLTHWGEKWARPDTSALLKEVRYLLENKKSLNLYVIHGGTNFGFTAGANSGGKGYEPDVTSYDYDAPIDEQGRPTAKYFALRSLISQYVPDLIDVPSPVPAMSVDTILLAPFSSVWANLPRPTKMVQPQPFESFGLDHGVAVYRTKLIGHKSGKLTITELHDYATIFLNGKFIGTLDRRLGERTIDLPVTDAKTPILEIMVESMGRINYGAAMIDRKGITERVTLNGMTLMNWDVRPVRLDQEYVEDLKPSSIDTTKCGVFFQGSFEIARPADTFLDLSGYRKGIVWVNGRNLGRYWEIGPQKRLYCPGVWLKKGKNRVVVFDLLENLSQNIIGFPAME